MIERFRKIFKRKTRAEKLAEQEGFPLEFAEMMFKMVDGEIPQQMVTAIVDEDGNPNINLADYPSEKE